MDMAELLPDRMGITSTPSFLADKDEKQPFKIKRCQVTHITEWVQCYSIYVAILTSKCPDKIQDLMGYQVSILSRHFMSPHVICVGSKGNLVYAARVYSLLVCRWFKVARQMEALSRGVRCDTVVNVWIVWQCQITSRFLMVHSSDQCKVCCSLTALHVR